MKKVKKELIAQKLDLVIQKLINLDNPENEDKLKEGGEAVGFFNGTLELQNGTGRRESDFMVFSES